MENNVVIIATKKSIKTAKILSEALGIPIVGKQTLDRKMLILNWGVSQISNSWFYRWINPPQSIANASNKGLALDILYKAGVKVPRYGGLEIGKDFPASFPVYLRKAQHSKGQDIKLVQNLAEFDQHFWNFNHWTEQIQDVKTEYRVHVFGDQIIHRQRKFAAKEEANKAIRNFDNGWAFNTLVKINQETADVAKAAIKELHLDFGAVDVVVNSAGEAIVLEVNTTPGLTVEASIDAYIKNFLATIAEKNSQQNTETPFGFVTTDWYAILGEQFLR